MEAYRVQQLVYLVVPVMLGMEFFMAARDEKKDREETPLGYFILETLGFLFMALLPAIFIFTIWAVESKAFPQQTVPLARFDRYAVMFFFMGAWWQVYLFGALRARRMAKYARGRAYLWAPFVGMGIFISFLVLGVAPWNLKWVSVGWFLLFAGGLMLCKTGPRAVERTMWVLTAVSFVGENLLFLWLDSVV
jgi:hypothetical protein